MNPEKMPTEIDKDSLGEELSEEVKAARAAVIHDMEHPDEEPANIKSIKTEVPEPDISPVSDSETDKVRRMVAKDIEEGMAAKSIDQK